MRAFLFWVFLAAFLAISWADGDAADGDEIVDVEKLPEEVKGDLGEDTQDFKEFNKKFKKRFKKKNLKQVAKNFKKNNQRFKALKAKNGKRRFKVKMNRYMDLSKDEFAKKVLLSEDKMVFKKQSNSIDAKTAKKLRKDKIALRAKGKAKTTKKPKPTTVKTTKKPVTTKATTKKPPTTTTKAAEIIEEPVEDPVVDEPIEGPSLNGTDSLLPPRDLSEGLPESFDWRDHGVITPVKYQDECGSCWTFSAAGVLEAQYARKNNKQLIDLAEMQMTCVYSGTICEGGATEVAFEYYKTSPNGLGLEKDTPYNIKGKMTCPKQQPASAVKVASHISLLGSTVDEIKEALIVDGPISVGVYVNEDFQFYGGGIFDSACTKENNLGGHAMVIVGYGKEDGVDYWLIKNSWAEDWGEAGYVKFRAGTDLCNIESKRLNQAQIV